MIVVVRRLILLLLLLLCSTTQVVMQPDSSCKSAWPELKGMAGEEAKKALEREACLNVVQIVPQDSMVTMDYREDRVRLFVDDDGKVVDIPRVG